VVQHAGGGEKADWPLGPRRGFLPLTGHAGDQRALSVGRGQSYHSSCAISSNIRSRAVAAYEKDLTTQADAK
jgi:hypothetical protein